MTPPDLNAIHDGFADHETFCRECLTVLNEQGELVPLELGPAQLRLNKLIAQQRERGRPVRIVVLKARRVQISTATAAQYFHNTPFRSGQHCAVLAHDEETANNLGDMYRRFDKHYRPFGGIIRLPQRAKSNADGLEYANGSWVRVATARNINFGRSFSLRRVQLDEFAMYDDADSLMTSVMSAVPKDPDSMVLVPSTANGIGNKFHRLWLEATDPGGGSEWVGMFFAWWEHPSNSMRLIMPADKFQNSLDRDELEIMRTYNCSLEQMHWRRWIIRNDLGGSVARFRQEHPSNPEEAFVASGRLYFDVGSINRMPVQRDASQGGLEEYTYGVERRVTFVPRERGELTVFKRPVPGRLYVFGVDTAEGKDANEGEGDSDSDFSVASGFDRDTGEQVAILRARIQPGPFGAYTYSLLRWYNNAGVVPEANGPGLWVINEITTRGYPAALIYHRNREPDDDPAERADKIGFKTSTVTRPILLSTLDRALREASIAIHDPVSLRELMTFVIKPSGKPEASKGNHDDTVIANALAVVGIAQLPRPRPLVLQERFEVNKYGGRGESKSSQRGQVRRIP